ncbi:MAG: ABC transporter substrate-binding protein [Gammaproteobacteria bacterium]|nr:ABC transporter substrate-binding protein [Gammaproteobacteria bacterium]
MKTSSLLRFASISLLLFSLSAMAAAPVASPNEVLQSAADKMFDAINADRAKIKGDANHTQKLVEEILLPNIDIITAAKYVLGKYWDTASKEQKLRFLKEFRTMLLRFYSSALTEYINTHDEKLDKSIMKFYPANEGDQTDVIVRSEVLPKNGKPVPVLYHMRLTDKGWKVYDVSVEGVSVITTYKTSFANDIQQNNLDALIDSLVERNAKLLAGGHKALDVGQKPTPKTP